MTSPGGQRCFLLIKKVTKLCQFPGEQKDAVGWWGSDLAVVVYLKIQCATVTIHTALCKVGGAQEADIIPNSISP